MLLYSPDNHDHECGQCQQWCLYNKQIHWIRTTGLDPHSLSIQKWHRIVSLEPNTLPNQYSRTQLKVYHPQKFRTTAQWNMSTVCLVKLRKQPDSNRALLQKPLDCSRCLLTCSLFLLVCQPQENLKQLRNVPSHQQLQWLKRMMPVAAWFGSELCQI